MASRLATTTSQSERAEATFMQRRALAERMSAARERGEILSIDIAQDPHNLDMFMRYAEQYGGTSAAAHALMDAELARQGLCPTRAFSDGSPLPASFGDMRDTHERARHEAAFAPGLDAARRANDGRVAGYRTGAPTPRTPEQEPSPIRTEIQDVRKRLQGQTASAAESFDSKAQIVETSDGTLKSKKSLFAQTGKQVAGNADVSLDAAKDAVKNLLKRNK